MALTARRRNSIHIRLKTVLPDADRQSQIMEKTREALVRNILLTSVKMRKVVRRRFRGPFVASWDLR